MKSTVLIASNDADFCLFLSHILSSGGFNATVIDPPEGADTNVINSTRAIIVESSDDIEPVLAFCRRVRSGDTVRPIPMMALIRSRHERYYLPLMKAGIDECILRPLAPGLIITCLNNVIARYDAEWGRAAHEESHIADLVMRDETRQLVGRDGSTHLSPTEYRLLKRLLDSPGHVVSRTQLIQAAWPPGRYVEPRTVDVHIGRLRSALEVTTGRRIIRTIRSNGFLADIWDDAVRSK